MPAPRPHPLRSKATFTIVTALCLTALPGCSKHLPDGRVAKHAPVQLDLKPWGAPWRFKNYSITPLAHFDVEARVLSTMRYSFDREAQLAPVDLALGWGPMSDNQVLEDLKISQLARFYRWEGRELPLEPEQIIANSANMHMVPADAAVRRTLLRVRRNDVVTFSGWLVSIHGDDGWTWNSSMSRTDTGDGACELVWVDSLEVR